MIDVPVPVKEALKDGQHLKNYRFVVDLDEWVSEGSFKTQYYEPDTITTDMFIVRRGDLATYKFVVDSANTDHTFYYTIGGATWQTKQPIDDNTWEFTSDGSQTIIEIVFTTGSRSDVLISKRLAPLTIDNDNLVAESVNIDERMCSGDTLKFGLCEGSSLEFQYFDLRNITGKRLQAFIDVQYRESPYEEVGTIDDAAPYPGYRYDATTAGNYLIYFDPEQRDKAYGAMKSHNGASTWYTITWFNDNHGEVNIPDVEVGDTLYLGSNTGQYAKATVYLEVEDTYTIPLGFFDVKKCSRQASTGIIKATCYNKLQSDYLDAKAVDQIVELIGEGEDNSSDVSIHKILTTLLEDYSIEPLIASTPKFEYTSSSYYARSVQVTWRNKSTPNVDGGYGTFSSAIDVFNVTLQGVNRNDGNYYYAKLLKAFGNKIQEAFDSIINQINSGYYDYYIVSGGGIVYTNLIDVLNNTVHIDNNDWNDLKGRATFKYYSSPYTVVKDYININEMVDDITSDIYLYDTIELDLYIPRNFELAHNTSGRKAYASTGISYSESVMPYLVTLSAIEKMRITESQAEAFYDVTLRDLQSAAYEVNCKFGKLDRITDLFSGVELNHSRLYPAVALYPANGLYPDGAAASANKSMYSQLWADEGNVHKWRYLIITYKGLDENQQEQDFTLQRTVNADGTDDYNMSDNWLFRNLVWTAADVGDYADAMVAKMQDITWFPFEMWCAGLPYLETGDEIEIPLGEHSYTSYILQRQLKGIQNLQDTYINGTLDIF